MGVGYQYSAANQRTRATLGDGTYWVYQYDALGQVVAGRRYWADGTEVAGQQFEYRFDDIGNRDTTGGRASAVSDYTANRLNQYNTRTVPPSVDVQGLANPTANVTVNGNVATRQGEYFHHALSVPNATAQYPTITVTSQYGGQQSQSGEVFVPAVTESFGYDADGNLTSDGRWTYLWDGENRLVEMKRDTSTPTLSSRLRLLFEYDAQGRRIRKYFYTHSGSSWVEQRDTICLYDGWNVVAEVDANASKARLRTYVWGSDLSGSLEGAGGVGGLLWVNNYQATYDGQTLPTGVHFVAYDGNGNVLVLTRASDPSVSARYEYGPFGEPVRVTGALAAAQPFRFSTKWTDAETGLLYYGYRYYNPTTGRWVSRDPIGEQGGFNLSAFVRGDPVSRLDHLGLWYPGYPGTPRPPLPAEVPHLEIEEEGRTEAVRNQDTVRAAVAVLLHNMLVTRSTTCTRGRSRETKTFELARTTSYASMYFTGYFLLGQVSVHLQGSGFYRVDCCTGKFEEWLIAVTGSFRDRFDELIPIEWIPVAGLPKGIFALPITFVGEWVEYHSGRE